MGSMENFNLDYNQEHHFISDQALLTWKYSGWQPFILYQS